VDGGNGWILWDDCKDFGQIETAEGKEGKTENRANRNNSELYNNQQNYHPSTARRHSVLTN
jgi:hypothetical protein